MDQTYKQKEEEEEEQKRKKTHLMGRKSIRGSCIIS